jgi:hypothetical protein
MTERLNSKELLVGIPVLKVRDTLLRCGGSFRADWLTDIGLPSKLCVELLTRGYIEKSVDAQHKDDSGFDWFDLTDAGKRFARASGASRIKLSTAAKTVESLKQRIDTINASDEYMLKISESVIFGSYAIQADTVGDIDFAFRTERKVDIFGDGNEWNKAAREDFYLCERTAKSFLDILFWPDTKVKLFLKNRQRSISLHDMDEFLAIQRKSSSPFIVVLGNEASIQTDITDRELSYSI